MKHTQTLVKHIRRVAREEARNAGPTIERYSVVAERPFTLEAFGSDLRLLDGQPDFDLAPGIRRRAKVGDTVLVATDANGDYMAVSETAGVAPSSEPGSREGDEGVEEPSGGEKAQEAVASAGMGVIIHGADGTVPRPSIFAYYFWIGTAEPENALEFDQWVKPE